MNSKHFYILIILLSFFFSCNKIMDYEYIPVCHNSISKKSITEKDLKTWYLKDIVDDSIPGISLIKAYKTILKNKKSNQVIVAVIDQVIDINHKDLKQNIWINTNEIPNNNIDDDKNGYIDDINGWDFLGNKEGVDNKYMHYDYVRMVKAYDSVFKDKEMNDIALKDSLNFIKYNYSKSKLSRKIKSVPEEIEYANNVSKWKNEAKTPIIKHFNYGNDVKFSTKILDSLKTLHPKDSVLQKKIQVLSGFIANGYTDEYLESLKKNAAELLQKQLNIEYNEREFLGDNPNDINDINYGYGYGKVNNNVDIYSHGTIVTGVILKDTPEIKIMPLSILGHGSSYDKDIAIAIRYAVDNGAKVINMSFGKMNSLHKEWVDDAIRYAEKK